MRISHTKQDTHNQAQREHRLQEIMVELEVLSRRRR